MFLVVLSFPILLSVSNTPNSATIQFRVHGKPVYWGVQYPVLCCKPPLKFMCTPSTPHHASYHCSRLYATSTSSLVNSEPCCVPIPTMYREHKFWGCVLVIQLLWLYGSEKTIIEPTHYRLMLKQADRAEHQWTDCRTANQLAPRNWLGALPEANKSERFRHIHFSK